MLNEDEYTPNQRRTIESLEIAHEYPWHQNEHCSEDDDDQKSSQITENNEILD